MSILSSCNKLIITKASSTRALGVPKTFRVQNKYFKKTTGVMFYLIKRYYTDTPSSKGEMDFKINGKSSTINLVWLRDNCRCSECYNRETNQKKKNDIKVNVEVQHHTVHEGSLQIKWNDNHKSEYDLNWIQNQERPERRPIITTWSGDEIEHKIPSIISAGNTLTDDGTSQLVKSLLQYGVAIVKNVTPTIRATKEIVGHIGPVMETLYGGMWELTQDDTKYEMYQDTAYTNNTLAVHTDNTYFMEPAGLQIFHCIEPAAEGGETILVDGFKAAQVLKEQNIDDYECLKSMPLEWQYISEKYHHTFISPIMNTFKYSDELEQIRYNIYDRSPRNLLTSSQLNKFYYSFKMFRDILNDPVTEWRIHLHPGSLIFINNWRVLHGRKQFIGRRKLIGCYQTMGTLLSKARMLRIIV